MKIRLGLIGLGRDWEKRHRPALGALADRFEVRAVCDQVGHRAQTAAGRFGAVTVDGFRALVSREDVDAILILSSDWYGSLPVLAACELGKSVYFGAGFDLEPADAEKLKDQVRQSGIAFIAELTHRYSPATLRLKELIATHLGPPELLFCHKRLAVDASNGVSGFPARSSIGRQLVKLVDWCSYVVGSDPSWVTGMMHRVDGDDLDEDYQMMSLGFAVGADRDRAALAQISCGRYIPAGWSEAVGYRPLAALQVRCRRGIAFVDLPSTLIWFDEAGRHQESLENERPVGEQVLTQFYRAVTSLVAKSSDLDDLCRALSIVQKAALSHREGRRIEL